MDHPAELRLRLDRLAAPSAAVAPAGRLVLRQDGLLADLSRLGVPQPAWEALEALAAALDVPGRLAAVAAGAVVNPSEGRAATHMALRDPARRADHAPVRRAAAALADGAFDHVLHIGIGGSALGPALLVDALGREGPGPAVRVVANIDGEAMTRAVDGVDARRTAVICVSKTFTTLETLTNLRSAHGWLRAAGVDDPWARTWAITAAPDRAAAAGVEPERTLAFHESVGGRYSLWSAVGLPLAVRCGWPAFEALLDGAAAMDAHVLSAPFADNLALRAAAADLWFAAHRRAPTRAVFAYDERLRLLPFYLQQLEMESNGKSATLDGRPVDRPTAAITWGGTGTDAQHAVFQLLHQGSHHDPVEFVLAATAGHGFPAEHHRQLVANALAQGAALALGRPWTETLALAGGDEALARQMHFAGGRPSSTVVVDRLDARRLGALLAFYEARTVAAAAFMEINPFDQWGVELGKAMATALTGGAGAPDALAEALQRDIAALAAQASAP